MFNYADQLKVTQQEPLPGQIANAGGGHYYPVDDWTRLDRFLILGTEGGSYYTDAKTMTRQSAAVVERCLKTDGKRVVDRIVEISCAGRAPKNDPALFALALAAKLGDQATRAAAGVALPAVARIGTHLFHYAAFVKGLGGWGRGTKRAFANWYRDKLDEQLVYDAIKYQQRDGWSHRDLLRKGHPVPKSERQKAIYHWITQGWDDVGADPHPDEVLARLWAFESIKKTTDLKAQIKLIEEYNLPHECVPNEIKRHKQVWSALLPNMGLTALIRNLGKLTSVGMIAPMSTGEKWACDMILDDRALRKARVHPMSLLVAMRTYGQGHGDKGSLAWSPTRKVLDTLDAAFYLAFKAVEPTNMRHMLALDVSGSMAGGSCAGMPISPREASAAMALVTAATEPDYQICAFSHKFMNRDISPRQRLDDVVKAVSVLPYSDTDCAQPMLWALAHKLPVDVFVIYTDNETNSNSEHPSTVLDRYRQKTGIPARLVVCAMVVNKGSIADPNDAGMLDVTGFDTNTPALLADFAR